MSAVLRPKPESDVITAVTTDDLKLEPFEVEATVTSKGQLTLPIALRERLGIAAGTKIKFIHDANGTRLEAEKPISAYFGSLRHLGNIDTTIPKELDRDFDYIPQAQAPRSQAKPGLRAK